jgi:hypothetical protein
MAHDKDTREIFAILEPLLEGAPVLQKVKLGKVFTELVHYVKLERMGALGWMHGDNCQELEEGNDPRERDSDEVIDKAEKVLCPEEVFIDLSGMGAGEDVPQNSKPKVVGLAEVQMMVENLRKSGQI